MSSASSDHASFHVSSPPRVEEDDAGNFDEFAHFDDVDPQRYVFRPSLFHSFNQNSLTTVVFPLRIHTIDTEMYCLDDVPPLFVTEQPANQDDILRVLFSGQSDMDDAIGNFHNLTPRKIALSQMRRLHSTKAIIKPMAMLSARNKIVIDPEFITDPLDPNLAWFLNKVYLDFYLAVPRDIGFATILPYSEDAGVGYTFDLHLHQPHRKWKVKHGDIGFNPTGRMLYIGRCRDEEVWFAAAPLGFGDEVGDIGPFGDSRMSTTHYHMWLVYFALTLSHANATDVWVDNTRTDHPEPIREIETVKGHTNIL